MSSPKAALAGTSIDHCVDPVVKYGFDESPFLSLNFKSARSMLPSPLHLVANLTFWFMNPMHGLMWYINLGMNLKQK